MNKIMALSNVFVFVGVVLVLGSVTTIPYTQGEYVDAEHTEVWADDVFTIWPGDTKTFMLDWAWVNDSIISTHVETTGDIVFKILYYVQPLFECVIKNSSVAGSKDLFWTYPRGGGADFVFENQNPVKINALITIKEYFPRTHGFKEVTRYKRLLDPTLVYPGVITLIAGTAINYAYTGTKKTIKDVNRLKLRASIILGFVGVLLVLSSVVTVPYTQNEWVQVEKTIKWADEAFTLEPNATKKFRVDNARVNSSIINTYVNETTDLVYFEIAEGELALHTVAKTAWENTTYAVPDEFFWTYPRQVSVWYFIFKNPNPVDINVSVIINECLHRASEWREVTRYKRLLDQVFAYPGIIAIIVGFALKPGETKQKPEGVRYDYDERWVEVEKIEHGKMRLSSFNQTIGSSMTLTLYGKTRASYA